MKKRKIIVQCLILAAAIVAFGVYWMYARAQSDTVGPEFTVEDSLLEISVQDPSSAYLQGISAYDKRDGDVTASIVVESVYGISDDNVTTVTYAAFDSAGNVTKIQRDIRFTDYEPPRFTLESSLTFPADGGLDVMDLVGAEDVLDGDIHRRVRAAIVGGSGTLRDEGTHQLQFRVTNSLGDTARITVPVEIYAAGKFNADLELSQYILYLPQGAEFKAEDYLSSLVYSNTKTSLSSGVPDGFTLKTDGTVNTYEPGVYAVSYTVSYSAYTGHASLIVVIEE